MTKGVKVVGLPEFLNTLELSKREARNLNRSTVHGIAGRVVKQARLNAPKNEGTLRKAIKAKRRRPRDPDKPFSDVMVEHGSQAKHDAFYWRFVEYGTINQPARPFMQPAADSIRGGIPAIYREEFAKKYAAFLRRKAKRGG